MAMNAEQRERPPRRPRREPPPDLPTQLEALFHQVWTEEERWRRDERIDLAVRLVQE
jgi:hypothetical protein